METRETRTWRHQIIDLAQTEEGWILFASKQVRNPLSPSVPYAGMATSHLTSTLWDHVGNSLDLMQPLKWIMSNSTTYVFFVSKRDTLKISAQKRCLVVNTAALVTVNWFLAIIITQPLSMISDEYLDLRTARIFLSRYIINLTHPRR